MRVRKRACVYAKVKLKKNRYEFHWFNIKSFIIVYV